MSTIQELRRLVHKKLMLTNNIIMGLDHKNAKEGGFCYIVLHESRTQELLFRQGARVVELDTAIKLGWFKPLRSGPTKQIYGVEYGMNGNKKNIRF